MAELTALMDRWFREVWCEPRREETIDELLDDDVKLHGVDPDSPSTKSDFKQLRRHFIAQYPDISIKMLKCVELMDTAAVHAVVSGTHQRTGQKVTFCGTTIVKWRNRKVIEACETWDFASMLAQIGEVSSRTVAAEVLGQTDTTPSDAEIPAASSNEATIRHAYEMWSDSQAGAASVEQWLNLVSDDVRWLSLADGAPGMAFSRPGFSRTDVERYFAEVGEDWEMVSYVPDEFICDGDRIVMLGSCSWRYRATGKVVATPKADFIRMRDGKIVEFQEFYDTARALAATL